MKQLNTTLLGAIILSMAGAAQAQSALNMNGTISATCTALTLANSTVILGIISDPSSPAALNAAAVNVELTSTTPSITCNGVGTTLSIDADPLTGPALPVGMPNTFSNLVNYAATINKSGTSAYAQNLAAAGIANATTDAAESSATVDLIARNFSIALSGAAAGGILVSGGYFGTATIALTPG